VLTVRGVEAQLQRIAVIIRLSNVRLRVQAAAAFASAIHSRLGRQAQPTATQHSRESVIGASAAQADAKPAAGGDN